MVRFSRSKTSYRRRRFPMKKRTTTIMRRPYKKTFKRITKKRTVYKRKRFSRDMTSVAYELFPGISHAFKEFPNALKSQMSNWAYAKVDVNAMINQLAVANSFNVKDIQWFKLKIWNKIDKSVPKGFLMQLAPAHLLGDSAVNAIGSYPIEVKSDTFMKRVEFNGLTKTMKEYGLPLLLDPSTIFRRLFADKNASNYKGLSDYAALYIFHSQVPLVQDPFDFSLTVKYKKSVFLEIPHPEQEYLAHGETFVKNTTLEYFRKDTLSKYRYYQQIVQKVSDFPNEGLMKTPDLESLMAANIAAPGSLDVERQKMEESIFQWGLRKGQSIADSEIVRRSLNFLRSLTIDNFWMYAFIYFFQNSVVKSEATTIEILIKFILEVAKALAAW